MSNFHNTEWAELEVQRARDKSKGKKLENNTYMRRVENGYAIRLHNTDILVINDDGTYTLAAGGYHTVTTMDRLRTYAPVRSTLFSESGEWFVRIEPSDDDPRPQRFERTIPRPYTPTWTPVPEPVKSDKGCQAGTMMGTEHINEEVRIFRADLKPGDITVKDDNETVSNYDFITVLRSWTSWVFYGEDQYSYGNKEWNGLADKTNVTYEQCPHCKAFDAEHEAWRYGMYGDRWGVKFDQQTGYDTYLEMMTQFHNDKDLWQQAYIEDFRARRAYLKADKEWDQRNRVPFYDGITVDENGYAPRVRKDGPSPAKLRRHEAKVKRVKKQIDKYIDGFIAELVKGMPMPSGGDCWYCSMHTESGATMGEEMQTLHNDGSVTIERNVEHLVSHMEEKYYVPWLAVNALRETGLRDMGVAIWLNMDPEGGTMGGPDRGGSKPYDTVRRALRKYLVKRLVPTAPTK